MLSGGTSTMAAAYERAIMHIAQSDDALAACALEAMQDALFLPGKGPFDDSCLSTFRAHDDAEKMNRVRIADRGDMATVCRADAVAESALTRAGKKMQRMIARQGSLGLVLRCRFEPRRPRRADDVRACCRLKD